jgi:hypothetical protein
VNEETLKRVDGDIASGNCGKARDRLHGLIATYPDALDLRRRLGDVYAQLQQPTMAGRYWYLEEDRSPEMEAACRVFEEACRDDPVQMLRALKFRGDYEAIADTFAGRTLLVLQIRAQEERGLKIELGKPTKERRQRTSQYGRASGWLMVGCLFAGLVSLTLMVVGLVTVIQWIF